MRKKILLVASLVSAGLLGSMLTLKYAKEQPPEPAYVRAQDQKFMSLTFAPMVKKATPAVVSVSSVRVERTRQEGPSIEEFFFGRGFGGPMQPQERRSRGLGSGVIVTADGYILTNNHVVEQSSEVKVVLPDRREFDAKVVGTDRLTDVAVLKINGTKLPVLPISDSTKVEVGDVALAIGNPFGIGQTVTMGIVSAKGRAPNLSPESYEDFIQTDAAINQGNSGGALINTDGQLIGINTAILTGGSAGNVGIGFAIPANMAKGVMDQLVKSGKVSRGYMGAYLQELTPTLAKQFGLKEGTNGVIFAQVEPNGPAAKAGLKTGDVVTAINGDPVEDSNHLRLRVSQTPPGSSIKLTTNRDGAPREVAVTLAERPNSQGERGEAGGPGAGTSSPLEGVAVEDLSPQVTRQLQLDPGTSGVVVSQVEQGSAAAEAGLRRGDVIQQVNRKNIASVNEFEQAVRQSKEGVLLLVTRNGQSRFLSIEPKG